MSACFRFIALIAILLISTQAARAATVTMIGTSSVVRTQTQGTGTYDVYDFYYTSTPGAEFTNYTITATATTGEFRDPARLQDDRQVNPPASGQDGNTAGSVDTWANTVMSSAAKVDGGFSATILPDPAGYAPTGSGASPGFTFMKWDVFDNVRFDDNNLNDHPDGPFSAAAPYHVLRLLAAQASWGFAEFKAYDTSAPGVPFTFNFTLAPGGNTSPTVLPEPPNTDAPRSGDIITTQFEATDAETPLGPFTFSNAVLANYVPFFPGAMNPPFNGTVDSDGTFTWDTTGFRFGAYTINVTATDPGGLSSSGGDYLVILFIPEPSTASLCVLAILGMSAVHRRRRNKVSG